VSPEFGLSAALQAYQTTALGSSGKGLILLCNAGSSSLKLELRSVDNVVHWRAAFEGNAEQLEAALQRAMAQAPAPAQVLHRVVHAGAVAERPALLDAQMEAQIAHWSPLAPLHNPLALRLLGVLRGFWPQVSHYALFDSGLYASLPAVASRYALPAALSPRWPLRRYGFHGLAHRSQWRSVLQATRAAKLEVPRRLLTLQLGGGCSLTAWRDDCAVDTTMGFSPFEGLVMATRSGSIDPGIMLHLLQQEGLSVQELERVLSKCSGLAALGPGGGDMRALLAAGAVECDPALSHYCYQIRKNIGAAIAALGGVDAISFGGGVGENQARVRQEALAGLEVFGIVLDPDLNNKASGLSAVHSRDSKVSVWLTPVDEMDEMFRQFIQRPEDSEEILHE
jgi:acetate kinase